ncbi:MAG: hypothetical protein GY895_05790 [Phycisphaera sp.]|nr:hypothetical protein [Phycisphaera sp.]
MSDGTNVSSSMDRSRTRSISPVTTRMLVKLVEAIRIVGTGIGFFLAYQSNADPPSGEAIRILAGTMAFVMCGTCAFEGLFLARATAREKGFDVRRDSNRRNPYQVQNSLWFLAAAIVGGAWVVFRPTDTGGLLLCVVLVLLFLLLSAANHAWEAVVHRNLTWQNLDRPILALAMLGGSVPILVHYF